MAVAYSNVGSVCEQVARLDLQRAYDDRRYRVETNIFIGPSHSMIGELDVVVFERATGLALAVFEIKCWHRSESSALRKTRRQRDRFFDALAKPIPVEIWSHSRRYSVSQFRYLRPDQFKSGGPNGMYGFDYQLPLTLSELEYLYEAILNCRRIGDCPQPRP